MSGSAQELHQFSVPELVFGALRECTRSRNQGIITRKLMRVIFLHNSTYKQQFCTAVVLPAPYLAHERPCTKTVHNGGSGATFWYWPTVQFVLDTSQIHVFFIEIFRIKYFGTV